MEKTTKEMKAWYENQEKLAKKFKLSVEDIHNIYDIFWIIDTPFEIQKKMKIDFRKTLKMNGLLKWYRNFFQRLDDICLEEERSVKNK